MHTSNLLPKAMNTKVSFFKNESNTMQALWVGMGSLSSFTLAIVSAAILSRYFDKTEYGTYRQILYVYSTLLIVFSAGLPKIFAYFLPRFSLEQGKDIVWRVSKVLFLTGLAFSLFLFSFSGVIARILNNHELAIGLKFFAPIPMLLLPTLGIEGIFSTYKKTYFIAIYNTLSRFLMLLFIVCPVVLFGGGYLHAIYGWLAVSVITLVMAYYFKGIPFKGVKQEEANLKLKEIFAFSLPLVTASIAGIIMLSADKFYVSRFFGTETFAVYSNGFTELPLVKMVTSAASLVLMPIFSKMIFEKKANVEIETIWKSTLLKSATVIYPMVVFFLFFAKELIVFLFSDAYKESVPFFRIAITANFFNIIIFAPLILAMGKIRVYSQIHWLLAFLSWTAGYLLIITFQSPYAIAFLHVALVIIKVIWFFSIIAHTLDSSILNLLPFKKISIIIFQSCLIAFLIKLFAAFSPFELNNFLTLLIAASLFGGSLLLIGPLGGINYFMIVKPLIKNLFKYKQNVLP
jgi:O-antigen/teichoic acid export membrane protein